MAQTTTQVTAAGGWPRLPALDPMSFARALAAVGPGLVRHPSATGEALLRYAGRLTQVAAATAARASGADVPDPLPPASRDRRFADPAWRDNAYFFGLLRTYLATGQLAGDLVEAAGLDTEVRDKAKFLAEAIIDALAPTNFVTGNPTVLKRAFDTGGLSLLRGAARLLDDMRHNGGRPSQVDTTGFQVGEQLATTPGAVVFRNRLTELIQYRPSTKTVYQTPILCSPPWINKYYIMDLAPERSFVEWAVQRGHTVFMLSYRNPGPELRDVTFDDYLTEGPLAALDVIGEITGAPRANLVGLCLGGTLTAATLAWLAAAGQASRVRAATLLNTLVDFNDPGILRLFTDAESVDHLQARMRERGYLDGREMSGTFDLLRTNDLIWNYVVSGWLMGQTPPAFDLLVWNADTTRMPAAMHSAYVRSCYVENRLARGELELAGVRLNPRDIKQDLYVLGAENDHITPWTSSYRTTGLVGGQARYVLSSAGHIAGVVNPPGPKARYWTNDDLGGELPQESAAWRKGATEHQGSWWEDWARWAARHGGRRVSPPPLGNAAYPPLVDAPGTYVLQR